MQTWKMIKTLTFSPWKKFRLKGKKHYVYMNDDGILVFHIDDMPEMAFRVVKESLRWEWEEIRESEGEK